MTEIALAIVLTNLTLMLMLWTIQIELRSIRRALEVAVNESLPVLRWKLASLDKP